MALLGTDGHHNLMPSFLTSTVFLESKLSLSPLFFMVQLLLCCFSFFSFSSSQTYSPTHSSLSTPWENYPLMPLNDIHIAKSNGSFSVFILLHCSASLNVVDYSVLPETIFLAATMTLYSLFSFFLSSYFFFLILF